MGSETKYYVYALIDPINKMPFYIGKGCGDRAMQHLSGKEMGNKRKVHYISNLRSLGIEPEIRYIKKNMKENDAYNFEYTCIKYMRENIYFPYCTNYTGFKKPPTQKGKIMSNEQKEKIANTLRGRPLSRDRIVKRTQTRLAKYPRFSLSEYEAKNLYIDGKMSAREMSKKFDVSTSTIYRALRRHGIIEGNKV